MRRDIERVKIKDIREDQDKARKFVVPGLLVVLK